MKAEESERLTLMEMETVRIDGNGPVRHLVLNRPEVHNAVNGQLVADLHQAITFLDSDPAVRVVLLRGEGKSFCSGADLKQDRGSSLGAMCHGYMIGGGAVLPAACDFRIGCGSIKLTLNEVSIGFNLTWNSIPVLVNLVGPHRAKEMLILGRTYGIDELDDYGFFTSKVDNDEDLVESGLSLANEVIKQPPVPVAVSKASINAQSMPLGRAVQHMDHVAVGYMGKSESSRTARNTYFSDEPRVWSED